MGLHDDLQYRVLEPLTADKHNAVVRLGLSNTLISGKGVRQHRTPFGTIVRFEESGGSSFASTIFRVTVTRLGDRFELRFGKGLIGGVEPTIDGKAISSKLDDGKAPALVVAGDDFNSEGVCGIYLRCELSDKFVIEKVKPLASPEKPKKVARVAHKLTGFIIRDGGSVRYDRELFSNLGLFAANRKPNGFFDPLFFWQS